MNKFVKFSINLVVFVVLALVLVSVTSFLSWMYISSPVSSGENETVEKIEVPQGMSTKDVAHILKEKKLVRSEDAFYISVRFSIFDPSDPFVLKSGTYTLKNTMSLEEIYNALQEGCQEYTKVSIPEGLTMTKTARLLEQKKVCSCDEFIKACRDQALLEKHKIPAESFEGYLFPDTYFFMPGMKAEDVLERLLDNFHEKIAGIPDLASLDGEKLHDAVKLASIVEREYRAREEAPLIASVFVNRIRNNIGLYSCATIEYIITEIQGKPHPERITYKDLELDSPYNTYKWAGLPYGPISNPGLVALEAVAAPPETDYFFFVLTDRKKGTHTFSKNFDQHKAADNAANYKSKR